MTTDDAPLTSTLLHGFRLRDAERHLGAYGVHVYAEGRGEVEHRFRSDDRVNLYSGSKTFTSLAVGIAADEGLLTLADPVAGFFPEVDRVAAGAEAVTIRDLLHMASGNTFTWFEPGQDQVRDRAAAFLASELVAGPGERFEYSNGCTYMLGRIVEKVSGQDLRDYLVPRIFDPLGIDNPQWLRCPLGYSLGASGLHLRTSEFARVGRLMLQGGAWDGEQLVPADYVAAMHSDVIATARRDVDPESALGYGYQVWLCSPDGAWRADGKYGQFSVVLPEQRAVVTITAHNELAANDLLRAAWEEILPLLSRG